MTKINEFIFQLHKTAGDDYEYIFRNLKKFICTYHEAFKFHNYKHYMIRRIFNRFLL